MTESQVTVLETCSIVWWKGYVKGGFQAFVEDDTTPLERSRFFRWRSAEPPAATDPVAGEALEELRERLVDDGWTRTDTADGAWYELTFTRPSQRPLSELEDDERFETGGHVDSTLLAQLRGELREARGQAELEKRRRVDAETARAQATSEIEREQVRRREAEERAEAQTRTQPQLVLAPEPHKPARRPFALVAYAVAVIVVGAACFVTFGSVYAAAVGALTAAAIALALDSWSAASSLAGRRLVRRS